jgi:uncharacterized membrane protein YhaH (DUF805 family)
LDTQTGNTEEDVSTPDDPHDPAQQQPGAYPSGPYPPLPTYGQQGYAPPGGYAPAGYLQGGSVGFGAAISQGFRNMFNYRGRASLSAYWWFVLVTVLAEGGIGIIAAAVSTASAIMVVNLVIIILSLLVVLPLTVRRLHDQDKSGFWIFIEFVPLIGVIWMLILLVREGTPGPNRFG